MAVSISGHLGLFILDGMTCSIRLWGYPGATCRRKRQVAPSNRVNQIIPENKEEINQGRLTTITDNLVKN